MTTMTAVWVGQIETSVEGMTLAELESHLDKIMVDVPIERVGSVRLVFESIDVEYHRPTTEEELAEAARLNSITEGAAKAWRKRQWDILKQEFGS